jgi:hypothetical protein
MRACRDKAEAKREFHWQAVTEAVGRMKSELAAASEAAHKAMDADAEASPDYSDLVYTIELGNLVASLSLLCAPDLAVLCAIVTALDEAHDGESGKKQPPHRH